MVEEEGSGATALGLLITGLMNEQDIDATELARRSGLGVSTIYSYTHGRARGERPRAGTLERIADALGVDPSELYAAADRSDARGERRLIAYFRTIQGEKARAEAIEAVRRIAWRTRPNE